MDGRTDGKLHTRLTGLWFFEDNAPYNVNQLIDVTVEHEARPTADLYAPYDPWQSTLLWVRVVHVLVIDELLEIQKVVHGVLLPCDQIQMCAHYDNR